MAAGKTLACPGLPGIGGMWVVPKRQVGVIGGVCWPQAIPAIEDFGLHGPQEALKSSKHV